MKKLENKVALVTGGGRGIGAAIANALAAEGAHIELTYIAHKEQAEQTRDQIISKCGVKAIAIKADVAIAEQVQNAVDTLVREFGRIDILVNNAGSMVLDKTLEKISLDDWNSTLAVLLTGVFLCSKAVLPVMLKQGNGRIINISSTMGLRGNPANVAYCAAKGGVIAFTKSIARDLVTHGILVNCIAPGPINTEGTADFPSEHANMILSSIPIGRKGSPEEVASAAVFLASSDGNYYVGQTLCPNGGELMI